MDCLQIVESLSVIIASIVAVFGINSWRREMRGRKEYELAEEVLTLFYEAKDKIKAIRSPLGKKDEAEGRKTGEHETPAQKEALDQVYFIFKRYQNYQETFNRLDALRYRFMALFGNAKVEPFTRLNKMINSIFIAANMLGGHYWPRLREGRIRTEEELDDINRQINKYEAVIWEGLAKPDPINDDVDIIIKNIEEICGPIIKRKNSK